MDLRENLALQRTRLANERTFLAYVRTSLSLLAGGVVLLQYFSSSFGMKVTGWGLAFLGLAVLAIGLARFFSVRGRLNNDVAEASS